MSVIKIEDWTVVPLPANAWTADQVRPLHLVGRVSHHPHWPVGGVATTSQVIGRRGDRIVTRSGSVYELGKASAGCEAQFPDVLKRLFQTLPEI